MKKLFAALALLVAIASPAEAKRGHIIDCNNRGCQEVRYDRPVSPRLYTHHDRRPVVDRNDRRRRAHHVVKHEGRGLATVGVVLYAPVAVIEHAVQFFIDRDHSFEAAVGIVGNLKAESNLDTRAVGDGGKAKGLAQWHPDRWRRLVAHAKKTKRDPFDREVQLEFVQIELQEREHLAREKLAKARTVEDGTKAFVHFERPRHYQPMSPQRAMHFKKRLAYAQTIATRFAHLQPTVPDEPIVEREVHIGFALAAMPAPELKATGWEWGVRIIVFIIFLSGAGALLHFSSVIVRDRDLRRMYGRHDPIA
jgi:hypothetical protein